jgi:hypothetical protein
MFLAELLYKILREQESSPDMFNFIQNSLMYYDLTENRQQISICGFCSG